MYQLCIRPPNDPQIMHEKGVHLHEHRRCHPRAQVFKKYIVIHTQLIRWCLQPLLAWFQLCTQISSSSNWKHAVTASVLCASLQESAMCLRLPHDLGSRRRNVNSGRFRFCPDISLRSLPSTRTAGGVEQSRPLFFVFFLELLWGWGWLFRTFNITGHRFASPSS